MGAVVIDGMQTIVSLCDTDFMAISAKCLHLSERRKFAGITQFGDHEVCCSLSIDCMVTGLTLM